MLRSSDTSHTLSPTVAAVVESYATTGRPIQWKLPPLLESQMANSCREGTAEAFSNIPADEIVQRYTGVRYDQLASAIDAARLRVLPRPFRGVGIELGAGCGALSTVVARDPAVAAVLAVEVVDGVVTRLTPQVADHFLGRAARKVIPVRGSFDLMELPDQSIDFSIEYHSLHHADDLEAALRELYRVLKPGSFLLAFDRVLPDSISDEEIEARLSIRYDEAFLAKYGYPAGLKLTRRENGEHEIRETEWRAAAIRSGFARCRFFRFYKTRNLWRTRTARDLVLRLLEPLRTHVLRHVPSGLSSTGFLLEKAR